MTEQLPTTTHDTPAQPTIAELITLMGAVIDPKEAERMLQEYRDGQAIVAEDARLEADTAECIQHQQLVAEQIRRNEQRRRELAPQLAAALQREADLQALIEGLAKLVYSRAVVEDEAAPQKSEPSLDLPLPPPHVPIQSGKRPPLDVDVFRNNTTVRRPLGRAALVQAAVRGRVK